jgi:hypothetical protein
MASQWVRQYGITEKEVQDNGIFYSDIAGGVCFPVYRDGGLHGVVVRKHLRPVGGVWRGAKYLTRQYDMARPMVYKRLSAHDVLVITEDILSAIKMGRYADTIALLTAHDKDEVVSLCKGYEKVIIYLDNDNAHVRDAQERLKARIGLVNRNVVVYRGDKDPKECSDDELLQIVNGQY